MNEAQNGRPFTDGEYRVGTSFNPSSNPRVDEIKRMAAALVDDLLSLEKAALDADNSEAAWCAKHAARTVEDAAMWGVKAATKAPR